MSLPCGRPHVAAAHAAHAAGARGPPLPLAMATPDLLGLVQTGEPFRLIIKCLTEAWLANADFSRGARRKAREGVQGALRPLVLAALAR